MIKIDDFKELSALHKAVLAAKFGTYPDPQYADITASPILAGVSNDIYDEMCRMQEKMLKGAGKDWQDWRRVKDPRGFRGQWRIAVMAARKDRFFMSATRGDKIKSAKCYLSPFTCTEQELDEFLAAVEHADGGQKLENLFKEHDFAGAPLYDYSYSYSNAAGDARLVLGEKKGGICDIFFSGVRTFRVSTEGDSGSADSLPTLKKHTVSSGSLQKFDAAFDSEKCKLHIVIEADTVDYWL